MTKIQWIVRVGGAACWFWVLVSSCATPSGTPPPGRDTVFISRMQFHPSVLYVNKWDTVVWVNNDLVAHDVTPLPTGSWTSDTIPPGGAWEKEISGDIDYHCSIHPAMKAKVIVRP